jgi:hypothetical protein
MPYTGVTVPESTPGGGFLVQPAPISHEWLSLAIGACAPMHAPGYFDTSVHDQDYIGDMVSDLEFLLAGGGIAYLTDDSGELLTDDSGDYLRQ